MHFIRIENPQWAHVYESLTFQVGSKRFFSKWYWKNLLSTSRKKKSYLGFIPYTRINSRRNNDLNVTKITENTSSKSSHKKHNSGPITIMNTEA